MRFNESGSDDLFTRNVTELISILIPFNKAVCNHLTMATTANNLYF